MTDNEVINSNYVSDILDEIALEGLDGITLEALWMRLSARQHFGLNIDENSKNFLWNIIICLNDVQFYMLPSPRPSLQYFNYKEITNTQSAVLELDEIYPYCSVKNIPGILGSCETFFTRVDITFEVIELSLREVELRWGNQLVVVASQESRNFALLGNFATINLDFHKNPIHYEILERIGRCRELGLATYGQGSVQSIVEDSKSVFHYFKMLLHLKLIKKHYILGSLSASSNVTKVYLTRFYGKGASENLSILQTAIEALKARPPNYIMPCDDFYNMFDPKKRGRVKKFKKTNLFKKYISVTKNLPYRTFFPNCDEDEWKKQSNKGERIVRCFQLIDPNINLREAEEKDCDGDDEDSNSGFLPRGIYYKNMPILFQAYHHIKNSGGLGLTQLELNIKMGLNKKLVRCLIKRLLAEKLCKFFIENSGRKRSKRYIVGENLQTKAAATELAQILSETTSTPAANSNSPLKVESVSETSQKETEEAKSSAPSDKPSLSQLHDENVSYRGLRRIGMIIKLIKKHRFRLFNQIAKYIYEEEVKEGLTSRIDRVTINKILKKLEKDGFIKIITLTGKSENNHLIKLFAEPSFELDDKLAETLYHTHSSYGFAEPFEALGEGDVVLENEFSEFLSENVIEMKKLLEGIVRNPEAKTETEPKKAELIYSPKFMRLNILHDFIFHLVYDYSGIVDKSQEELLEELCKTTAVDDDLKKDLPKLYGSQCSTYMFVPPLKYSGKLPGWCLISDLLLRVPLSVATKILRVGDTSPELMKFLHHPVRKNFLVKDLPLSVRKTIFSRRHHLGTMYSDLKRLCFIGLIQYGMKFGREYYQSSVYLNRRASLLDTSSSPPDYCHVPADIDFEVKSYFFKTKSDVKKYWMDMFNICMATKLGVKNAVSGKMMPGERELCKETLKKAAEPKCIDKVHEEDDGRIPGDRLGAAGLDSIMFSFLKGNWTGSIAKSKEIQKESNIKMMPLQRLKKDQAKKKTQLKKSRRKKTETQEEKNKAAESEESKKPKQKKDKEKESRVKRERKSCYDEIDLEALKLMNNLRVTWSTAEDNLLLLCRVAALFLCPNCRTFVRIPWIEYRKVLQQNLPESRDKTQKAIARRTINMLKNPTTVRSVNFCLEELRQMPDAKEMFDCSHLLQAIKPSATNLEELQSQLYEKFHQLVDFLKNRLSLKKEDKDLIPDTLEEFYEKFLVESPVENELSIKIIRENVIRAILVSSLSCRADKTSTAVQLFEIYRQYDDEELQNAIKELHTDKVITISKKGANPLFKRGKILPVSFSPYKLSFVFQHMLTAKYTHSIYPESFSQINDLKNFKEEFEVDLNECNLALFLLASKDLVSFRSVLPEQILALDSAELSDLTYSKILKRYCEILQFSETNSKVLCTSGKIISKGEVEEDKEIGAGVKRKMSSDDDSVPSKKDKSGQEENIKKTEEKKGEEEAEESKSDKNDEDNGKKEENEKEEGETSMKEKEQHLGEKSTRSSRVILYMLREEAKKDANNFVGKFSQDSFAVNASKIWGSVNQEDLDKYLKEMDLKTVSRITKSIISRSLVPIQLVDEKPVLTTFKEPQEANAAKNVLDFITSKKELGATVEEIKSNCGHEMLSSILASLGESKIIIRSGIHETRYFSQKYATPWVLSSFKLKRLEREKVKPTEVTAVALTGSEDGENPPKKAKGMITSEDLKSSEYNPPACSTDVNNKVKIIIRPWIRIDGSLNRKVLDRFLGVVLSFIMTNPGVSLRKIMDKFSPTITPIWTKDLVEILHEIGCIKLTVLTVKQKVTLFSKLMVEVSDVYTGLEDDSCVVAEAKVDAVTTLGLFIGKKTYSRDFLSD